MMERFGIVRSIPAFLAALLLIFASSSHIHQRFCLDGDEAPISIHFESEDSHSIDLVTIDDLAEVDQADVERELSFDTLLSKIFKTATVAIAVSTFHLPETTGNSKEPFTIIRSEFLPDGPESLLPPSRAPPALA
ncbi:MAG: hypothetical protein R3F41_05575 [Gammaproteobacteria bacterium]|jgi:transcription termination factor Rho